MLKEFQRESKEIIEKIYEITPPLKLFYLIRKRGKGLKDVFLPDAIESATKGLRDFEYAFYNDIQTPELLFNKNLLIQKNILTINIPQNSVIKKYKPEPLGYVVEPNYDEINIHGNNLLDYLSNQDSPNKIMLKPLIQSLYLRLLPDGTAQVKYNDDWYKFAAIDLEIKDSKISSGTGKLLNHLIGMKKLNEETYKYSKDAIKTDIEIDDRALQTTIDTIRSAIKKVNEKTGESKKVDLYRERGTKQIVFVNISQEEDFFKNPLIR